MNTIMTNPLSNMVLALAASASMLGFLAAPVRAESVKVDVSAFDVHSVEGRKAIDSRVQFAAEKACAVGGVDFRSLTEKAGYEACVDQAVAGARTQVAAMSARTQLASR